MPPSEVSSDILGRERCAQTWSPTADENYPGILLGRQLFKITLLSE
jgi:hypothetical protein